MTNFLPRVFARWIAAIGLAGGCVRCVADTNVIVSAFADPEYTQRKFAAEEPRRETYVVMRGRFFAGLSVDRSIDKLPFRRIAEVLAPELSKRNFLPAKGLQDADLLIIVHWGTTNPRVSSLEMMARTSPVTDTSTTAAGMAKTIKEANDRAGAIGTQEPQLMSANFAPGDGDVMLGELDRQLDLDQRVLMTEQLDADYSTANIAKLLGYSDALGKYGRQMNVAAEEMSLRHDITKERYFIILCAYDLHKAAAGGARSPVWTIHLNMSSGGNNFQSALFRMSISSVNFVGRTSGDVKTVRPVMREGTVEIGTPVILGEAK